MKWDEKTFAKFVYLGDVKISRDGEKIAYVLTKANLEKNEYESTVVVEFPSGSRVYIENASTPRFSPSGEKLVFTRKSDDKKRSQMWIIDLRTMSEKKLAEVKVIKDVLWKNDDRTVAILGFKRLEDEDMFFESDIPVWFDSMGFLDGEKGLALVFDTESMEVIEEVELDRFSTIVWHGEKLICTSPHREGEKLQLWRYDIYEVEDSEKKKIFENVFFRAVHSNGKYLVLLGKEKASKLSEHDYVHLWNGKELISLTEKYGRNNYSAKIDERGRVYFTSANEGRITLSRMKPHGEREVVYEEDAYVMDFDISDDGKVVFISQSEDNPGEIFLWDGETKRLTNCNDRIVEKVPLKRARHFRFRSDDLDIDGWYMKPDVENEEKKPVIVFVHGGPKGMYGHRFVYMMQHLVSEGFYVVYFNPRGSDGYDEDFALRVLKRTGQEDFKDIMNGIEEFLKLEPSADPERIGITGISYGGFMTNWAVTQTDLFKAAVSENGVSNWLSMYGFSDISLWFVKEVVGEDPFTDENYRKLSPFFHVKNVKTPVLIIHSLEDYRCPLDQSVMFYHALKDLGKEAYIAVFKKGAHGHSLFASPRHRSKRHKLIVEFFKRKLVQMEKGFPIEEILKGEKKDQTA